MRAGIENPALAAGLARAIDCLGGNDEIRLRRIHMRELRTHLETELIRQNPAIKILGARASRLPNTSLLLFPDTEGDMLVHKLMADGVVASTGSACSQGSDHPSHVVTSMGVPFSDARNVLRLSMSHLTDKPSVQQCLASLGSS